MAAAEALGDSLARVEAEMLAQRPHGAFAIVNGFPDQTVVHRIAHADVNLGRTPAAPDRPMA